MKAVARSEKGVALTNAIPELFRVNNLLLSSGDRLVASLGLTSARWQVLGAIVEAGRPQPVAWLARDLGAHRQNVQRIINDLVKEELVVFQTNPHHRRAQLVVLTEKGRQTFETALTISAPWANGLAEDLTHKEIEVTRRVLASMRRKMEEEAP